MTGAPPAAGGPRHTARYSSDNAQSAPDGRLFSKVFARNFPPVLATLVPMLAGRTGAVLEIGCGTGQHAAGFALAFPGLAWWPSDPDAGHRASARAWATELGAPPRAPLALDAGGDWATGPDIRRLGPLEAVLSMNVIHIAPVAVMQGIVGGAARVLAPGGLLIFYGPFTEQNQPTSPGNADFDAGLRADNPDWGLRDVGQLRHLAREHGLDFAAMVAMPANNHLISFRKPICAQE